MENEIHYASADTTWQNWGQVLRMIAATAWGVAFVGIVLIPATYAESALYAGATNLVLGLLLFVMGWIARDRIARNLGIGYCLTITILASVLFGFDWGQAVGHPFLIVGGTLVAIALPITTRYVWH